MCRALRVLCAADDPDALARLKRAVVSSSWELVGGAVGIDQLVREASELGPDVVVIFGLSGAARAVRPTAGRARVVVVGAEGPAGADATAPSLEEARSAILGIPRPGGPVRA